MDGIQNIPMLPSPTPRTADSHSEVTRYNKETLMSIGISEGAANQIIGDNKNGVTEEEAFKALNSLYETNQISDSGEIFSSGENRFKNYKNGLLLERLDSLDGKDNIGLNDEGNLAWNALGAENLTVVEAEPFSVAENIKEDESGNSLLEKGLSDTRAEKTEQALAKFLKSKGLEGVTDIKYAGSITHDGKATKGNQFHIFSFKNEAEEEQTIALESVKNPDDRVPLGFVENFQEFASGLSIDQYNQITGEKKINADNYFFKP